MKNQIKKYSVRVTKQDGATSIYHVLALSAGGAEETVLREVYAAKFALATNGYPDSVKFPDLISKGASIAAVEYVLDKTTNPEA